MIQYQEYVEEIAQASKYGKLVFFVGAGLSTISGYPQWGEIVDEYYRELYETLPKKEYSSDECLKIPQIYYDIKGKEAYNRILKRVFEVEKKPNTIHYKILAMNPAHIITTNYDNLLEKTCTQRGKYYSHISAESEVASASSAKYLLKVHGDFSQGYEGDHIILKESDYINYDLNFPLISNLMKTIMATHTIVFIGYGLGDYNINVLLNWVKHLQKDGYNKPFFLRTEPEPIAYNDKIYYENKGLRIIDAIDLAKKKRKTYLDLYNQLMDFLIDYKDNEHLNSELELIDYIYAKIEPIINLKSIRKYDLSYLFDYDYYFQIDGGVIHQNKDDFDYLSAFFDLADRKDLKYQAIQRFFKNNGIVAMAQNMPKNPEQFHFEIDNLAYANNYLAMEAFVKKDETQLEFLYEKAFYLVYLCRWEEAYELYTQLIEKSIDGENWCIYYLSQINRYWLFHMIKNAYFESNSALSKNFLKKIKAEMKNFRIEDLFHSMPYEFQERYKMLEFLSNQKIFYGDIVQLFQLTNKVHAEINQGSYSLGMTDSDKVLINLLENIRFLYENSLCLIYDPHFRRYIKNSLMILFEKAEYDQMRDVEDEGVLWTKRPSKFFVNYYDFINISKAFGLRDLDNLEKICNIRKAKILDKEEIERYILRTANFVMKESTFANPVYRYNFLSQAKTIFCFARHIALSPKAVDKVIKVILFFLPGLSVRDQYRWCSELKVEELSEDAASAIEIFLLHEAMMYLDEDFLEHFSTEYRDFVSWLLQKRPGYRSRRLSDFVLLSFREIKILSPMMYDFYRILDKEAQDILREHLDLSDTANIVMAYEVGMIASLSPYKENIFDFLREYLTQIIGIKSTPKFVDYNTREYVVKLAIQYFVGEFPEPEIEDFLSCDDEFDLFVNPETFNYERFQIHWLKHYSDELLEKMAQNRVMNREITKIIRDKLLISKDHRYMDILVKFFL